MIYRLPVGAQEHNNHERVYKLEDRASGLSGFIAIHNRALGPAVGGTRLVPYGSLEEALEDALRLSRAMTYKCAVAGVRYGGGKGVIIADPEVQKTPALLEAYARCVGELQGIFFTGEDVGLAEADVQGMLTAAPYFIGKSSAAGDPSPYAARSVFQSMPIASTYVFGTPDLHGRRVAIKGVGKVGGELARLLVAAGAEVYIADIKPTQVEYLKSQLPSVQVVAPEQVHRLAVDIFAPCALGNDVTEANYNEIQARLICGGANNQLANPAVGDRLCERGILYVPDFIANAGGLLNVVDELEPGGYQRSRVLSRIQSLGHTLTQVLNQSRHENRSTQKVAEEFAEHLFLTPALTGAQRS